MQALYDLHETEQKDMQYQLKIGTLDKENAQQLYRLEVQVCVERDNNNKKALLLFFIRRMVRILKN
jgi:hypothetical protein